MTGGGPKSEEGKSVSRWNAAKHGLRSPAPVVPGVENKKDWEVHREGILESLSPEGHLEQVLAERVALQSWRLNRVIRYERENIALSQEKIDEDRTHIQEAHNGAQYLAAHLTGVESAHDEDLRNAKTFLSRAEKIAGEPDEEPVSGDKVEQIFHVMLAGVDREMEFSEVDLPGAPEPVNLYEPWRFKGWNTKLIRQAIEVIATHTNKDLNSLLEVVRQGAQDDVDGAMLRAQALEDKERDRMSRERLLPEDKTLEKIARYEAHISRQMYQALHELEALQTRRAGGSAPLGRLDVQGLPET